MILSPKETARLQRLIDAAVKANNAVHRAEQALNKFCDATWGFAPSDRDLDSIIDDVFGGCGQSIGMDAADFISEMNNVSGE